MNDEITDSAAIEAVLRIAKLENAIATLRAENARLLDEFFRMQGENLALEMTNDSLRAENARLLEALKQVLAVANVRIDDPRILVFDAARSAIAEAEK